MKGPLAAKEMAHWVSTSTEFSENTESIAGGRGVPAEAYLALLEKTDRLIRRLRQVIPDNHVVFELVIGDGSFDTFEAKELKIALALDGQRTIGQVVSEVGLTELETLHVVHRLHLRGRARKMSAYPPMVTAESSAFLEALQSELVELVGPAADIIMSEAFRSLRLEPELLAKKHIPQLIDSISQHLDPDEMATFTQWILRTV